MTDVSLSHRGVRADPDADRTGDLGVSPPARRLHAGRWRDPRLWLGVLVVVASVVAGAALFSSADDTVAVWAVDDDLRAGTSVTPDDVHAVRVHFGDGASADLYLPASQPFPVEAVLSRDLAAGEMVAAAAVSASAHRPDQLPLEVSRAGMPAGLEVGDTVDVWAVPSDDASAGGTRSAGSRQVLEDVRVTALSSADPGGLQTGREVLVALPGQVDVGAVLDGLRSADVVLVRVGA